MIELKNASMVARRVLVSSRNYHFLVLLIFFFVSFVDVVIVLVSTGEGINIMHVRCLVEFSQSILLSMMP